MWHNAVHNSVYFRHVRSKFKSGCTPEAPNEIRDSKPLIQLVGHPKATMRYEPHFLARNERQKQKEICLPNSVIMSHSRFLLVDVTILIVCVLWSRTLKKVKVQNRIESTVGKRQKEQEAGIWYIRNYIWWVYPSWVNKRKIMTVLMTAWPDVYCQHRQSDRQTYGSIVSHLCLSNLDETSASEYPRASYGRQKVLLLTVLLHRPLTLSRK